MVMVAAGNNKGVQRLIVKPEIKTPEALKGKRIGVTIAGLVRTSGPAAYTTKMGAESRRCPSCSTRFISDHVHQSAKNGIDGAVLQDPSFFMAEDAGFKTLADPAAMDIQYLQNVLVASRAYLQSIAMPRSDS